jgi:hypothetical protein
MFQLRIVRRDGSTVSSGRIIDAEYADRLARQCRQDPAVQEATVVQLPPVELLPEFALACAGCGEGCCPDPVA